MTLQRAYYSSKETKEFGDAISIANSLKIFASDEELAEKLKEIPDSPLYYKYVVSGEYGWEIHILYPVS